MGYSSYLPRQYASAKCTRRICGFFVKAVLVLPMPPLPRKVLRKGRNVTLLPFVLAHVDAKALRTSCTASVFLAQNAAFERTLVDLADYFRRSRALWENTLVGHYTLVENAVSAAFFPSYVDANASSLQEDTITQAFLSWKPPSVLSGGALSVSLLSNGAGSDQATV